MTKTYFESSCGKIAVIIEKVEKVKKDEWKMILWDKELNILEEGQTLKHKQLDVKR